MRLLALGLGLLALSACVGPSTQISASSERMQPSRLGAGRPMSPTRAKALGSSARYVPDSLPLPASAYDAPAPLTVSAHSLSPSAQALSPTAEPSTEAQPK